MNFSETGKIDSPEYKASGLESFFIFLSISIFSAAVFEEVRALFVVPILLLLFLLIGSQLKWKSLYYLNVPLTVLSFINIFPIFYLFQKFARQGYFVGGLKERLPNRFWGSLFCLFYLQVSPCLFGFIF